MTGMFRRMSCLVALGLALAACQWLPGASTEPSAAPTQVAPEVEGGSLTPEPTVGAGPSNGAAPDADNEMPTPEPTIGPSEGDAPDADNEMPTPEPTIGPSGG